MNNQTNDSAQKNTRTLAVWLAAAAVVIAVLAALLVPKLRAEPPAQQGEAGEAETAAPIIFEPMEDTEPVLSGLFDDNPPASSDTFLSTGASAQDMPVSSMIVESSAADMRSVPLGASFTVKTDRAADVSALRNAIRVTPMTAVTLEPVSDDTFTLSPKSGTWRADTLYQVTLGDASNPVCSYAFQTQHVFAVKSVLPGDGAEYVPVDTGIEITFTDPVKNADIAQYLSISPAVACGCSLYPDGKTAVLIPKEPLAENTAYTVTVKAGLPADNGTTLPEDHSFRFRTVTQALEDRETAYNFYTDTELLVSPGEAGSVQYHVEKYSYDRNDTGISTKALRAKIWQYPDASAALNALETYQAEAEDVLCSGGKYVYPTDGLSLVFDDAVSHELINNWTNYEYGVLTLPALDGGIYLCEISYEGECGGTALDGSSQLFLQVSALRAYTESSEHSALVWLNRTNSTAAENASVTAYLFDTNDDWKAGGSVTEKTVKTDKNGLAELDTEGKSLGFLLLADRDDTQIVCTVFANPTERKGFLSYIYTDREVYFPNDTVRFWGVLKPAFPGQTLPSALYLCIGSQKNGAEITVDPDGTYSGSYTLEDWTAWGVNLNLYNAAGEYLVSKYVRVTQEEKPVYKMDVSFDKPFYTYHEPASVTVETSFYDGTPAPGLKLYLSADTCNVNNSSETVTDDAGKSVTTYRTGEPSQWQSSTDPVSLGTWAELVGYETTSLSGYDNAYYFHASANFRGERLDQNQSAVYLNKLDTSKLLTDADFRWDVFPRNTDGAPLADTVTVSLKKYEYIKVETGSTTYDPITKRTRRDFYYDTRETIEKTFTAVTENGVLKLDHVDRGSLNGWRQYVVTWTDPQNGHTYTVTLSADKGKEQNYDPYSSGDTFLLSVDNGHAKLGDTVSASLTYGNQPVEGLPVLMTRYSSGKGREYTGFGSSQSFAFTEDHVLGAQLYATVFANGDYLNGQSVMYSGTGNANGYTTLQTVVSYDYQSQNALEVSVTTDHDSYRPGETAVITLNVPGVSDGKVLVSLVDEACFTLGEQDTAPLSAFFGSFANGYSWYDNESHSCWVPYISANERFSCFSGSLYYGYGMRTKAMKNGGAMLYADGADIPTEEAAMGEMEVAAAAPMTKAAATGGMASSQTTYVRENFSDNPVFTVVEVKNGKGTAEITVPDNITTWRITAVAASGLDGTLKDAKFGSAVSDTVCTQPYFITASVCELYITGDEVSLSARSFGSVLPDIPEDATAVYHAVVRDDTGKTVGDLTVSDLVRAQAWFNFGALDAGSYTVTVEGRCGDYADAVKVSFTVADTAVLMNVRKEISVSDIASLSPKTYPVTLVFHDDSYDTYLSAVHRLMWGGVSRTDVLAASYAAQKASEAFYGADAGNGGWYRRWFRVEDAKSTLSNYYGFLPLISYGQGDPVLTAKVLYAIPEVLSEDARGNLVAQYRSYIENGQYADEEELSASMMALAALGEPVLNDLYTLAAQAGSFPVNAQLYLCAAFAAAGDYPAAQTIWNGMKETYGDLNEHGEFSFTGSDTEETIDLTAQALFAASRLDRTAAESMVKYLLTHTSTSELYVLEIASYVTHFLPTEIKESTFTYTLADGTKETVTLRGNERYTLYLTKSDFKALKITDASPALRVSASYGGTAEEALAGRTASGELQISKKIEPYSDGMYLVTLSYSGKTDRNYLSFSLADCIPSGARYVSTVYKNSGYSKSQNSHASIYNKAGQQLAGSISASIPYLQYDENGMPLPAQPYSFSGSVSYLIRGAVKGTFAAEPAVALSYDSALFAMTEKHTVTIQDGAWEIK